MGPPATSGYPREWKEVVHGNAGGKKESETHIKSQTHIHSHTSVSDTLPGPSTSALLGDMR